MTKPADSRSDSLEGAFERLDEIASGGGAEARFWRVYGRYATKKTRPSLDEHLEFALAAYDAGRLPAEAVTCMVVFTIDLMDVQPRVEKAYSQGFHKRYEAIRRAFGLSEDEDWAPGEAPAESQALDAELEQAEGRIRAEALSLYAEKTGHPLLKEIAALARSDPRALEKRREAGRQLLLGSRRHEAVAHQRAKGSIEEPEEEP